MLPMLNVSQEVVYDSSRLSEVWKLRWRLWTKNVGNDWQDAVTANYVKRSKTIAINQRKQSPSSEAAEICLLRKETVKQAEACVLCVMREEIMCWGR